MDRRPRGIGGGPSNNAHWVPWAWAVGAGGLDQLRSRFGPPSRQEHSTEKSPMSRTCAKMWLENTSMP